MCLLEGVGGQLEAATGGSSQLPTCRVRPTAHLVASTSIGPAATGPGPIQTQEVASIRLAAMNSFLIGQAAAVTRQSPRSTVMVSSPLQQPNSSMAPDSNHSHVIGRKVIVRIINSSDHDHDEVESNRVNLFRQTGIRSDPVFRQPYVIGIHRLCIINRELGCPQLFKLGDVRQWRWQGSS